MRGLSAFSDLGGVPDFKVAGVEVIVPKAFQKTVSSSLQVAVEVLTISNRTRR